MGYGTAKAFSVSLNIIRNRDFAPAWGAGHIGAQLLANGIAGLRCVLKGQSALPSRSFTRTPKRLRIFCAQEADEQAQKSERTGAVLLACGSK